MKNIETYDSCAVCGASLSWLNFIEVCDNPDCIGELDDEYNEPYGREPID